MSSSGMKGVDAGDGRALAENLQLGAQGTAKVRTQDFRRPRLPTRLIPLLGLTAC